MFIVSKQTAKQHLYVTTWFLPVAMDTAKGLLHPGGTHKTSRLMPFVNRKPRLSSSLVKMETKECLQQALIYERQSHNASLSRRLYPAHAYTALVFSTGLTLRVHLQQLNYSTQDCHLTNTLQRRKRPDVVASRAKRAWIIQFILESATGSDHWIGWLRGHFTKGWRGWQQLVHTPGCIGVTRDIPSPGHDALSYQRAVHIYQWIINEWMTSCNHCQSFKSRRYTCSSNNAC